MRASISCDLRAWLAGVALALGLAPLGGCDAERTDREGPASWRAPLWSGAALPVSADVPPSSDDWIKGEAAVLFAACPWSQAHGFSRDCAALEDFTNALERRRPSPASFRARLHAKDPKERALAGLLWEALEPEGRDAAHLELFEAILVEPSLLLAKQRVLDAARLPPSSKVPGLRAKVEGFVERAPPALRGLFLSFVTIAPEDMVWIEPLLRAAIADKDPTLRLAGLRGLSALPDAAGQAKACSLWQAALAEPDARVRHYAQNGLVGSVDFMVEDEDGLLAGRASPLRKPCADEQIGAAVVSAMADAEAKQLDDVEKAVFFAGALRTRKPEVERPSVLALRGLAEDADKSVSARVIATRALRLHPPSAKLLEPLQKDKDPRVAAAARGD